MFRTTADQLNLASRTRSLVEHRYRDEEVRFATAVTILETPAATPTGWSLRRFLQRRGNVVITDARIFVQSNFVSLFTVIWLAVIGYVIYGYSRDGHMASILVALVSAMFIFQRRPYSRDIPLNQIHRVEFGSVQGIAARCDIMSIMLDGRAIQLVTAQRVPDCIRERIMELGKSDPGP